MSRRAAPSPAPGPARQPRPSFADARVKAVFDAHPRELRADLLTLRALIFDTAAETEGVGGLVETLKWGQPAYAPAKPRTGSTIRIDALGDRRGHTALFFHCQTTLVSDFRQRYPDLLAFQGNRAVVLAPGQELPRDALKHCIALALTYHARRRGT